jgi:alpha-glucosidase
MSMESVKRFIDFAAESGFPYMLLDEGWSYRPVYDPTNLSNADILRTRPNLDMPALVNYARGKGVGLLLWVQWDLLDKKLPEAFDLYASWGIKGVKIDFMGRNDQDMVDFYHRVMEEAAKRRLLVDMHSAYPPTGLNRTFPNYITQEGVMGAEYPPVHAHGARPDRLYAGRLHQREAARLQVPLVRPDGADHPRTAASNVRGL